MLTKSFVRPQVCFAFTRAVTICVCGIALFATTSIVRAALKWYHFSRVSVWSTYATGGEFHGNRFSLSSDGKLLAYASPRTGHSDIYILNRVTGASRRLTSDPGYEGNPAFMPDGKSVVFERELCGFTHLFLIGINGGPARQLTSDDGDDLRPQCSVDGMYVYFVRRAPEAFVISERTAAVYRLTLATGQLQREGDQQIGPMLCVARDGRVLSDGFDGKINLKRVGGPSSITICKGSSSSISPNGKWIAFIDESGNLCSCSTSGAELRTLVEGRATMLAWPLISPDGRHLLFVRSPDLRGDGEILESAADGSGAHSIARID